MTRQDRPVWADPRSLRLQRLLRAAGRPDSSDVRVAAELLESRMYLAGLDPAGTGTVGVDNVSSPRTLGGGDVSVFDITGRNQSQFDRVSVSSQLTLGGLLVPSFPTGYTLQAGDRFRLLETTGSGSLQGAFAGIAKWNAPTSSSLNFIAIQGPNLFELVATDLATGNLTIATASSTEAESLAQMFAAGTGSGDSSVTLTSGTIHALEQRIEGQLTFSRTAGSSGFSIVLANRDATPAGRARLVSASGSQTLMTVFGTGSFTFNPYDAATDPGLRSSAASPFAPTAYAIGPSTTPTNPGTTQQVGPIVFLNTQAHFGKFTVIGDAVDIDFGIQAAAGTLDIVPGTGVNPAGVTIGVSMIRGGARLLRAFNQAVPSLPALGTTLSFGAEQITSNLGDRVKVSADDVLLTWDPSGQISQQVLQADAALVEVPDLKMKFDLARAPSNPAPGEYIPPTIRLYGNGFELGNARFTLNTSTFGSTNNETRGYYTIGNNFRIADPFVGVNNFGVRYDALGVATVTPGASFSVGAREVRFGEPSDPSEPDSGSLISLWAANPNITIGLTNGVPSSFMMELEAAEFQIRRYLSIEVNNITVNTKPDLTDSDPTNDYYFTAGLISGELSLSKMLQRGNAQSTTSFTIGAEIANFGIDADGRFIPGAFDPNEDFRISGTLGFGKFTELVEKSESTDPGEEKVGDQLPTEDPTPGGGSFNVTFDIYWEDLTDNPEQFVLVLREFAIEGTVGSLTLGGTVTDLVFDSKRIRRGEFPIVYVGEITGTVSGQLGGTEFEGQLVAGSIAVNSANEPMTLQQVIANTSAVARATWYFGGTADFEFANNSGFTVRFAFSTKGFIQAYLRISLPTGILLEPNSGLTINDFSGGITFGAPTIPTPRDPAQLDSAVFKPTLALSFDEWREQIRRVALAQSGGSGGYVGTIDDDDDDTDDLNTLNNGEVEGTAIPDELQDFFLDNGFPISGTTKRGSVKVLQADDSWLLSDRSGQFLISRRVGNQFDVFYLGNAAFSDAQPGSGYGDLPSGIGAIGAQGVTAVVPGTDLEGNAYPQNLVGVFQAQQITISPTAVVKETIAGERWSVTGDGVSYVVRRIGLSDGKVIYVLSGGDTAAFGTDAADNIRVEAGFTLYSQYISRNVVEFRVDAIIDSSGKFLIAGEMLFGSVNTMSSGDGARSEGVATAKIKVQQFFDLSDVQNFSLTMLTLMQIEAPVPNDDPNADVEFEPVFTVHVALTFGFYKNGANPGDDPVRIDGAYLAAEGVSSIAELLTDGDASNDFDFYQIDLKGSERLGVAAYRISDLQQLVLGLPDPASPQLGAGSAQLRFSNDRLEFRFDLNLSATGLIEANSFIAAAGVFVLEFETGASFRLRSLHGVAALRASTQNFVPLNAAGVRGQFNALLKLNVGSQPRMVELQLPGQTAPGTYDLRPYSFGLYAQTNLVFEPPVVGGAVRQEIFGLFGLEISRDGGIRMLIMGEAPVPLPIVGQVAPPLLKADVLGLFIFTPLSSGGYGLGGRLELALQDNLPSSVRQYFSFNAQFQMFLNTSGQRLTFSLPQDFVRSFASTPGTSNPTIPANLRARLDPDNDGLIQDVSVAVPAGAPRIGWRPGSYNPDGTPVLDVNGMPVRLDGPQDANGPYLVIMASGTVAINAGGGGSAPGLLIDASELTGGGLRIAFKPTQFDFSIGGRIEIRPLGSLVVNGTVTIVNTGTLLEPDFDVWGSLQLGTSFQLEELKFAAALSIDLNTSSSPRNILRYYDRTNRVVLTTPIEEPLPADTLQVFAGGQLKWNDTTLLLAEFQFTANPNGLAMAVTGVMALDPLANVSVTGSLLLNSNGSAVGFIDITADINLNPLTFSGQAQILFNTSATTQRLNLLDDGNAQTPDFKDVEGGAFMVYVRGNLSFGVFRLGGHFTFLNNSQKLSISGAAALDLYVAQVNVDVAAEIYKSAAPGGAGLVLDVGIGFNVDFFSFFRINANGRLQLNTRAVATTTPAGNTVPARISSTLPYLNINATASVSLLGLINLNGSFNMTTINDTEWQQGWSAAKRNWRIAGSFTGNIFGLVSVNFGSTADPVVFYDSGEFTFNAGIYLQLGPNEFNIYGNARVNASFLRQNNGDSSTLNSRDLTLSGSGALGVAINIDLGEIDFGALGTLDLGSINERFDLVSGSFSYNGANGEFTVTVSVIGYTRTFTIGFLSVQDPPPVNLAGPAVNAYTQDGNGYWRANWNGGVLNLNTGSTNDGVNRARLRNSNGSVTDESYTLEGIGEPVNGRQRIKVSAFGLSAEYADVTEIFGLLGDGNDTVFIRSSVKVPVRIEGGAGNDKITYEGTNTAILLGGEGNDRITAAGGAGSRAEGEGGNDVITWLAGTGPAITITGGDGVDQFLAVTRARIVDQTGAVLSSGDDIVRISRSISEQFRISLLNSSEQEIEFVAATSGFESLRLNTLSGADRVIISDFAASGLQFFVDLSRFQTGTITETTSSGSTRTSPAFGNDTQADSVSLLGGASGDIFTLSTSADASDLDADQNVTEINIIAVRSGNYTLNLINLTSANEGQLRVDSAGGDDTVNLGSVATALFTAHVIVGGDNSDVLTGTPFNDVIWGDLDSGVGTGNDTIRGGRGNDRIHAGGGDNVVYGEEDNDQITTGSGRDLLDGGDGADALDGGLGDDTYTGGLGTDTYADAGGRDTLIEARNVDLFITDRTFIVGSLTAASAASFGDQFASTTEFENLFSIFEVSRLTGGAASNTLVVGDVDGKLRIGSNLVEVGQRWTGTADLTGGAAGDRYIITVFGLGNARINIVERAADAGKDLLRVNGANLAGSGDTFLIRPNFIAALGEIADQRTRNADRVGFDTALEGATVHGLLGDDQFIVDDTVIPTTIEAGGGRDFVQIGQLFGAARTTPYVAVGDDFETSQVDLTPAGNPAGSIIGYLSNGASEALTVNAGDGDDRLIVFRNRAVLTLNGQAGNDSFSVRAFALVTASASTQIAGGGGADSIEYAANADVDINGGDGLDSIRILGTQFGDTFTITEQGINGAGLSVRFAAVESLELYAGDGHDSIYVLATPEGVRVAVFGGAGSDHFYVTGVGPAGTTARPDTLGRINGPLLIEGGPGDPNVFGLGNAILMAGERDRRLPAGAGTMFSAEQAGDVDTLDIIATAETGDFTGTHASSIWPDGGNGLSVHTLSGLGMGGPLTQDNITTPGGISYRRLEIIDAQLGSGAESLTISSVAASATTIFRGNGGADHFTFSAAAAFDAVVVLLGDNTASRSHTGVVGNDILDASSASQAVTLYGGAGTDTLLGGSAADRIFGGSQIDVLGGGGGDDLIIGDSGIDFDRATRLTTLRTSGGVGLDPLDQVGADIINPGDGADIVFGDHGSITQLGGTADVLDTISPIVSVQTVRPDLGSPDLISARRDANPAFAGGPEIAGGDDLVFGGLGADTIIGGLGNDVLVGDHGRASLAAGLPVRVESTDPGHGAGESISGGDGHDRIIAGTGADTVDGGDGDDVIFGDHGLFDTSQPANANFVALFITAGDSGAADTIFAGRGHDIVLGQQGDDRLYGQDDDDDLIGGHNVVGGIDELDALSSSNDFFDGGAGDDVIAGDNALVVRIAGGGARFRLLTGPTMYLANGTLLIGDVHQPDPRGTLIRTVTLLDHDAAAAGLGGVFGHDLIAGGADDDVIFGQLGNDQIRGDGALVQSAGSFSLTASTSPATDGDDYVEGNGGNDAIWGDLGRDDLIGGSSSLFGLGLSSLRIDGTDMIFGGDGTRVARNFAGDSAATGHAADSDFILGDNGNVFRLVSAGGQLLTFAYDNYSPTLRLVPRGVQFLDYSADNSAPSTGAADEIRGEDGDDTIHGMTGDDTLYGDAHDDDVTGGLGNDWIFGGTGQDGLLGDDGLLATARNGVAESIYGVAAVAAQTVSAASVINTTIFNAGALQKYATLPTFRTGGDDVIYAGLGDDFVHGGEGMDAISGAEALSNFYNPVGVRPALVYSISLRRFLAFDPGTGLRKIAGFFLNFEASINNVRVDDGRDTLFGDHGHDWLVGGTNQDRIFGGMGDDVLNADDNLETNNGLNFSADSGVFAEADITFGGGGLDRLIGNTTNDRLIDWVDDFNQYLTPFTAGYPTKITNPTAAIITALRSLGRGGGADQLLLEPNGELGLVQSADPEWVDQIGRPLGLNGGPRTLTGDWDVSRRSIPPVQPVPSKYVTLPADAELYRFDG